MINKHAVNTIGPLISALTSIEDINSPKFGIVTPSTALLEKDLQSITRSNITSPMALGYVFSKDVIKNSQKYRTIDNTLLIYDGNLTSAIQQNEKMEKESRKKSEHNHIELAQKLIINGTGAFVFIFAEKNRFLFGRDPLGIQPFYYGENETHFVFASNRRILWKLKIENSKFFPPGQICIASQSELTFKPVKNFDNSSSLSLNLKSASKHLLSILEASIIANVKGLNKCAIAFSGGLDSSLIAFLAKKYVKNVQLIHVSLADRHEIEEAKKAASILDLPIKIYQYDQSDVQEIMSKVIWLIEDSDPIKVSIGIPFYWIAEKTKQLGFEVLLAGQGADELFGGYKRYLDIYLSKDQDTTRNQIFTDITNMHENNLARDMKLCTFHGITLLCPFISTELVEFALRLPIKLKLEKNLSSLRKLVLRQVGHDIGMPSSIVEKPKKAIQYSTGVNNVLKKIAKKNGKTLSKYINCKFENQE